MSHHSLSMKANTVLTTLPSVGFSRMTLLPTDAGKADKSAVLKVVTNPKGVLSDKLRLVAVWLLTAESLPSQGDFQEIEQVLRGAGADLEALNYLKRLRNLSLTGSQRSFAVPSQNTTAASSQVRK